jgi:hypothetical protein
MLDQECRNPNPELDKCKYRLTMRDDGKPADLFYDI